jgi:16S rRNA G966 N2-methylase RsmD
LVFPLILRCAPGLETIAKTEIAFKSKFTVQPQEIPHFPGYLILNLESSEKEYPQWLSSLHCFEIIGQLLRIQSIDRKLHTKTMHLIRELFDEVFDVIRTDPQAIETFSSLNVNITIDLEKNNSDQIRQIQAIINKLATHHGLQYNNSVPDAQEIILKWKKKTIILFHPLPFSPGNFYLKHIHPTGVHPMFMETMWMKSFEYIQLQKEEQWRIIDPMMGTAGILRFFLEEYKNLCDYYKITAKEIELLGFEHESKFFGQAQENITRIHEKKPSISIKYNLINNIFQNANKDKSNENSANIIITQPPYGHSIAMDFNDLKKLYHDLFEFAKYTLKQQGILTILSPQKEIIDRELDKNWEVCDILKFRQHSIGSYIYVLRKAE